MSKPPKPDFNKTPQEVVHDFWDKYFTKKPGKVTSIFPRSHYASLLPDAHPRGASSVRNATTSYEAAAKDCREQVARIVKEAHRNNEKFMDLDFNIEWDSKKNCLNGLVHTPSDKDPKPKSVHRVDWIFDEPKFTKDGYSSSDLMQGSIGDCWWVTAVANIANRQDLMNKICVARDEQVGVYGFVFYRDGDWFSVVVDDNLYLRYCDFDHEQYDPTGKHAREEKQRYQTGSEALYFAKCQDPNETWLPLLEKAYAKAHGDYTAIAGGLPGEGVEDMTGGICTSVNVNSILNRDKFWKELVNVDGDFVFSCSTDNHATFDHKGGLPTNHAYSVLKATEEVDEDGNKVRLVLIRNPWGTRDRKGMGEWNGPWSDGSNEWTPYWLKRLGHTFGNDGTFWMTYQDMLRVFSWIERTRLFDEKWTVIQQWTGIQVGWIAGYHNTKFILEIKKAGHVVVVLSQLDHRYFKGLKAQYKFRLYFILRKEGETEHICRAANPTDRRSVNCEIELEAGRYEVLPKITAERKPSRKSVEEIVKCYADKNPAKLRQVGMQYDLAHAKGGVPDEESILTAREAEKKQKEEKKKQKEKERLRKEEEKRKEEERKDEEDKKMWEDMLNVWKGRRVITTTTVKDGTIVTKTEEVGSVDEANACENTATEGGTDSKDDSKEDDKPGDAVGDAGNANDDKNDDQADDDKPKDPGADKKGKNTGDVKTENSDDKKEENAGEVKPEDAPTDGKEGDEEKKHAENEGKVVEGTQGSAATQPQLAEAQGEAAIRESDEEPEEELDEEEKEEKLVEYEEGHVPWNAVCFVGLRVYSQDAEARVTLAETKSMEEGANLVVDSHAVGPTMAQL